MENEKLDEKDKKFIKRINSPRAQSYVINFSMVIILFIIPCLVLVFTENLSNYEKRNVVWSCAAILFLDYLVTHERRMFSKIIKKLSSEELK